MSSAVMGQNLRRMRFESKRDLWIVMLMRVMPAFALAIIGSVWYRQHGDWRGTVAGAVILIIVQLFFVEYVLRSTYYEIDGDTLFVRSSFITWRVPIREIR